MEPGFEGDQFHLTFDAPTGMTEKISRNEIAGGDLEV